MKRGSLILAGAFTGGVIGVGILLAWIFVYVWLFPPQGPSHGGDEILGIVFGPPGLLVGAIAGAITVWRYTARGGKPKH